MNNKRLFDRPQLIIGIIGISAFFVATILYVVMLITADVTYLDNGEIDTLTYNPTLFSIRSIFSCIYLLALVWFVIRLITFKMRNKEEDLL